jgi:hypothetical protein
MKTLLVIAVVLFVGLAAQSQEYEGLKLGKDKAGNFCALNKNKVALLVIDSSTVNVNKIIGQIEKDTVIKDRQLIARVLELYPDAKRKFREIENLTVVYNEVALLVLKEAESSLEKQYSKGQLEELKQKKK